MEPFNEINNQHHNFFSSSHLRPSEEVKAAQPSPGSREAIPSWMVQEKISFLEKFEVKVYQLISIFPVFVTFGLYTYLLIFYILLYIYPSLSGSFQRPFGMPDLWQNSLEREAQRNRALLELIIFSLLAVMLGASIIQTIRNNPGSIPEDKEWDMLTDSMAEEEESSNASSDDGEVGFSSSDNHSNKRASASFGSQSNPINAKRPQIGGVDPENKNVEQVINSDKICRPLTNDAIVDDAEEPKEQSHLDYKYLKSYEGPMIKSGNSSARLRKPPVVIDSRSSSGGGSGSIQNKQDKEHLAIEDEEKQKLISKRSSKKRKREKEKKGGKVLVSFERKKYGGIRMCQRCLRTKPDRCHHCSQCNRCVLKMDHHCPWVANCIGFYNYKYFMNMLFYTATTIIFLLCTATPLLSMALYSEQVDYRLSYYILTSYLLAGILCLVISGFFSFHVWLISTQFTTIEFCEKRSDGESNFQTSPYNLGVFQNFKNVFGPNIVLWFVPFRPNTRGEGLMFEVREELKAKVMSSHYE